ncbi:general odorant-binding protein 19d-like [Musca domestica]|uniref:General odorant-binding protein 19d-like n=1 Tax=Musca domestica TaxID=7370 RepID=A0ABM3UYA7_MUSDO|nr:general odorant-binding protein 19d-like [Musca domestica]
MQAVILALLAICTICYCFDPRCLDKYLGTAFDECTFEHGGNKAYTTNWAGFRKSVDTNEKCFRACVLRKCDFLDEEAKIKEDVPLGLAIMLSGGNRSKVPSIEQAARACRNLMQYGDNICENTENWSRCITEQCKRCGLELKL